MAIKLEITVNDDCPYEDIWRSFETQMQAIGFSRIVGVAPGLSAPYTTPKEPPVGSTTVQFTDKPSFVVVDTLSDALSKATERFNDSAALAESVVKAQPEPTLSDMDGDRKRGEAGPGHRRRTNAQIAADEAYFKQKERAEAALREMDKGVHPEPGSEEWEDKKQREHDAAISSGEERINPEDAADEAAETAERPKSDKPTLEDLRAAVSRYIAKFGAAATVKDIRGIIGRPVHAVPDAEIPAAIAAIDAAIAAPETAGEPESLFGGEPVAPITATAEDVVEALKAYGRKYDGSEEPDKMPITGEDGKAIFGRVFGEGVTGLGSMRKQIGATPEIYGKIHAALVEAREKNLFKREVRA